MIDPINSIEGRSRTMTRTSETASTPTVPAYSESGQREQRFGYSKVFRWPVPAEQTPQPTTVEVVGSFSGWRKVPLSYDRPTRTWQVMLNDIEGNRTHRYVILVDGKPSYDKTCDGLVAPQTPDEAKWGIQTPRGSRVLLMFAQSK
jgi:hypothetical protein